MKILIGMMVGVGLMVGQTPSSGVPFGVHTIKDKTLVVLRQTIPNLGMIKPPASEGVMVHLQAPTLREEDRVRFTVRMTVLLQSGEFTSTSREIAWEGRLMTFWFPVGPVEKILTMEFKEEYEYTIN